MVPSEVVVQEEVPNPSLQLPDYLLTRTRIDEAKINQAAKKVRKVINLKSFGVVPNCSGFRKAQPSIESLYVASGGLTSAVDGLGSSSY